MAQAPDPFSKYDETVPKQTHDSVQPSEPEEEMVPKSRLNEVIEDRNRERASREQLILGMLGSKQRGGDEQNIEPSPLDAVLEQIDDEDVAEMLRPAFSASVDLAVEQMLSAVSQKYGPVLDKVAKDDAIEKVASNLGTSFSPQLLDQVRTVFESLPPDEQKKYNNDLGAELLARRIIDSQRGNQAGADLSGMAHSAPFGATPPPAATGGPTDADILNMPPEEWERFKAEHGIQY